MESKQLPISILYVEDEDNLREVISHTLEKICKRVVCAANGEEGLQKFKEDDLGIDVVISDITMPKMNGLDMATEIRKLNENVPIIITSAHSDKDLLLKALAIELNGYILKPVNFLELYKKLTHICEYKTLKLKLEEERIEHQKAMIAKEKFSALGHLSAGIIHEINTPITYMKMGLELMNDDISSLPESNHTASIKDEIKSVMDGMRRLEGIVSSMREIAGAHSGDKIVVNIFHTLVVALNLVHSKSKNIVKVKLNDEIFTYDVRKDKEVYNCLAQPARIEQLWIIILNNALDELVKIDSYDERELNIYISCNDDKIKVRFCDSAGGISDEIKEKIFEAFFSTKNDAGMGIGLDIAKKIVASQDGEIKAYNENKGAVFEIILPLYKEEK